ncbi:hypothetical protein KP509_31G026300 [Ceratopteris richardii]|uniref:MYND-type domain-containing protein n=1 Tax=Ceratopteris richardii TaxID=49495 RepID=A0A8T2QYL9_CERRI|nr:hypothetical protein KP509_31G026300 [Ceratopteris richardii]
MGVDAVGQEGAADELDNLHELSDLSLRASPHSLHDDEDDEEEGDEPTTLLGFLQKPEHPWSLSRHLFPSKAGGTPAWLDPINLPQGEETLCGICQKPLQFLLQVYAAIDGREDAFHRTLFVFMCPDMNCLQKDKENQHKALNERPCRSVKVFRCQLCRINNYYSKDPPKKNGSDSLISKGAPLCSWCGTWKGQKICGGCKKAKYCSRQHQVEHWKFSHGAACKGEAGKSRDGLHGEDLEVDVNRPACRRLWPEFEIVDEEEASDDDASSGNMALIDVGGEDDVSRQFQEVEPSLEQKHWASFQARISRMPDQVIRYCRSSEARPLWPRLDEKPPPSGIPPCSHCNSPRIFEFQILPQLLYYFKVSNDRDALDWGTIAIYSCEASCSPLQGYVEEFAWVQSSQ